MTSVENNMYKIEVIKLSGLNKMTKSIRFRIVDKKDAKHFSFIPGQFVMLSVLGYGESALAITTSPSELPEFEVAVKSVGVATQAMHRLKVGDIAYFSGPMGNAILSRGIIGRRLVLVAGGIGLIPLRSLIHAIKEDRTIVDELTVVYGAKTPEDLIFKSELKEWAKFADVHIVVDKADRGWTGQKGSVVDTLRNIEIKKDAFAIVCGPPVMYDAVAKTLLEKGLDEGRIEFMLERRVKCGIGKCQHCTCGGKYVCLDGPTFSWKELKDNSEAFK